MQKTLVISDNVALPNALFALEAYLNKGYKVVNSVVFKDKLIYIVELINKPVETTNEQLEYLAEEELIIINNALNRCHGDKTQISFMMRKLYQIANKIS